MIDTLLDRPFIERDNPWDEGQARDRGKAGT